MFSFIFLLFIQAHLSCVVRTTVAAESTTTHAHNLIDREKRPCGSVARWTWLPRARSGAFAARRQIDRSVAFGLESSEKRGLCAPATRHVQRGAAATRRPRFVSFHTSPQWPVPCRAFREPTADPSAGSFSCCYILRASCGAFPIEILLTNLP